MDQAAWLAYFDQRAAAFVAAERERIDERIRARVDAGVVTAGARVVVLRRGLGEDVPDVASARRVQAAALSAGWDARTVRSLAVDPTKGLIESVTVRFARHDERGFAAWWNGRFQCAWLLSPLGLERLGMRTTLKIRAVVDAIEGIQRPLDMSLGSQLGSKT